MDAEILARCCALGTTLLTMSFNLGTCAVDGVPYRSKTGATTSEIHRDLEKHQKVAWPSL